MNISYLLRVTIDGQDRTVRLRVNHWLPRLLGSGGITIGPRTILLKRGLKGPVRVAPILVCHELVHVAQCLRWGRWTYYRRALWQRLTIRQHHARPLEAEADGAQTAILRGTHPSIFLHNPPW